MVVTFEWDLSKAATNIPKHGIAFEEAATIFRDALATTFPDPDHSVIERREITIGYTIKGVWHSFPTVSVIAGFGS